MGIHITPTVDGNVTVGPDAENTDVLDDYSVPQANMDSLAVEGAKLWPHILKKDQIRTFAGIQPKWVDENGAIQDWKVEIRDDVAPNAVNLVGIESPGLTGSVPLARYVIGLMLEHEKFEANPDFDPHHKGIVRFAECTPEQQAELIAQDPDYGEMICSCEEVTKAVPKDMIFPVMDEIRKVVLTAPVKAGTIVLHNVCGLDSDVMVTKNVDAC